VFKNKVHGRVFGPNEDEVTRYYKTRNFVFTQYCYNIEKKEATTSRAYT
jgi:hypothetical protein